MLVIGLENARKQVIKWRRTVHLDTKELTLTAIHEKTGVHRKTLHRIKKNCTTNVRSKDLDAIIQFFYREFRNVQGHGLRALKGYKPARLMQIVVNTVLRFDADNLETLAARAKPHRKRRPPQLRGIFGRRRWG